LRTATRHGGRGYRLQVYRKGALPREQALQCKATMASAVNLFADRAQADAVLFTTMDAATKSAGLRGKDVFYTVLFALGGTYVEAPVAAAILELALVDGTSGELLWSHRVGATFRKSIDPAFLVNLAFAEFPQFPSGVRTAAIASSPDSELVVGPKNERGAPASVPGSGAERRWRAQAQARYSLAQ
jgi:hypothetical protein